MPIDACSLSPVSLLQKRVAVHAQPPHPKLVRRPRFGHTRPARRRSSRRGSLGHTARQDDMAGLMQSAAAFWNHPAGPKTIFFWAPTMKWGITAANIKDFSRPPELLSVPQQAAVATTGLIWMKYSLDITPKNYNLMSVNAVMAATGLYQLYRKMKHDQEVAAVAKAAK